MSAALSGCAPLQMKSARNAPLDLNGPPPDVVVLAMSGRCTQPCRAPRDNYDYLTSRGTLDALADVFTAQGLSVQVAGYADNALAEFQPLKVVSPQQGYAALWNDYQQLRLRWMNQPRPPRVVLLGHSHGAVWLHQLVRNNPSVPVALQIDLDSNCALWTLDHRENLAQIRLEPPELFPALRTCDLVSIEGQPRRNKDIVWPNVAYNLEVQSKRLPAPAGPTGGSWINYTFELTRNVRPDGGTGGIEHFVSTREDHSNVAYPDSDAVRWVLERTRELARFWNATPARPQGQR